MNATLCVALPTERQLPGVLDGMLRSRSDVSGEGEEVVLVVFEANVNGEGTEELSAGEGVPPVFVGEKGARSKRRLVQVLEDERAELGGNNATVHGGHHGWLGVCLLWTVVQLSAIELRTENGRLTEWLEEGR